MSSIQPLTISFEFFPPKTPEGVIKLSESATKLAVINPEYFSVTFGAGGSTREGTVETVKMLQLQHTVSVVPHLSCIGMQRDNILEMLNKYRAMQVKRIVALRGDLPSGMVNIGDFKFASELIAFIRETTGNFFYLDVAAYPEIHPQARSVEDDVLNLKRKYEAGANSAITQYFFNPDAYFYYLDECAKYGVNMPIVPGIMPISQFANLVRFSDNCGAEIPRWIRKRLESYGDDIESLKNFGVEVVSQLCQRLIAGGAPGLHFYTLNKADETLQVIKHVNFKAAGMRSTVFMSRQGYV